MNQKITEREYAFYVLENRNMTVFGIDKSKYTEEEIDNMRKRHEDSRQAKIFFTELFGEYKADVITSNIQIQYHNEYKKWGDTFEEAWQVLGYRVIADIIFRAINGLPCAKKDTGEKEAFLKDRGRETTYELLTQDLDEIINKLHQSGEANSLSELSLLASQLGAIKENLARLLWIELPELNDGDKFKRLFHKQTGIFFNPGIFEIDVMRQAFFKRQALLFFDTEEKQQAYIKHAENQYLGATKTYKEIMKDTKKNIPNASYQEKRKHISGRFAEAMA